MKTDIGLRLAIAFTLSFAFAADSFGQDVGLFNGNGIKSQWGKQTTKLQFKYRRKRHRHECPQRTGRESVGRYSFDGQQVEVSEA